MGYGAMADPDLGGLSVVLVGDAEPALLVATHHGFASAGCLVSGDGDDRPSPDLGAPDIAVVFCRHPSRTPILGLDDAAFASEVDRQLLGPQRAAMASARAMAGGVGGAIVFVGSIDTLHAYPGRSVQALAMGGVLGLTRAMAIELAASGVRTNLVVAGPLGTEDGEPPPGAALSSVERTLLRSPSHQLARPSEVAAAIRFVAGPDAAFMTGQTLRVDGGWASLNQAPEGMRFP
jgi:3-oxoacyl-[acyl-carrier protein] reductase